jgi:hypothetical protein
MNIVQYGSESLKPTIAMPLSLASWRYSTVFFQVINPSDCPMTSLFTPKFVGNLFQENKLVNKTISIVGGIYASHANILSISSEEKHDLCRSWIIMKERLLSQLQVSSSTQFTAVLLSAILMSYLEVCIHLYVHIGTSTNYIKLLVDETCQRWLAWVQYISEFVLRNDQATDVQSSLDTYLIALTRIQTIFGSDIENHVRQFCLHSSGKSLFPQSPTILDRSPDHIQVTVPSEDGWQALMIILECWAILRSR